MTLLRMCYMCYRPWIKDRYMAPDIDAATKLLQEEKVRVTRWFLFIFDILIYNSETFS